MWRAVNAGASTVGKDSIGGAGVSGYSVGVAVVAFCGVGVSVIGTGVSVGGPGVATGSPQARVASNSIIRAIFVFMRKSFLAGRCIFVFHDR